MAKSFRVGPKKSSTSANKPARQSTVSPTPPRTKERVGPTSGLTASDLQALPILKNPDAECKLVEYILARMDLSKNEVDLRAARMLQIDTQLSGFITKRGDDRMRDRDNKRGKKPKPTDHNLPLAEAQLDEAGTYLMSVYAPNMTLFESMAGPDKQGPALALTAELNREGQRGQHYREVAKFCSGALRYNLAALTCYWESEQGIVFTPTGGGGGVKKDKGEVWRGNVLKCPDGYNFYYDTSVHPVDLPQSGEFYAEVAVRTPFWMLKKEENKQRFGVRRFIDDEDKASHQTSGNKTYYTPPPDLRDENVGGAGPGNRNTQVNWAARLRAGTSQAPSSETTIEEITWTGWLNPKKWKLSADDEYQVWRICLAQSQYITFGAKLENTHGMLPVVCTAPNEDTPGTGQRTYAEKLLPLQHFGSFLLNTHQDAVRKAIYGVTVYNAQVFPGLDLSHDDLVAAVIPMKSSAQDIDIDKVFRHYQTAPGTDKNLVLLSQLRDLMQQLLPTAMVQQVTDLDRATEFQTAAVVQAGNRRNLKLARIIADQSMNVLKFMMLYNIYANVDQIEYVDPVSGKTQKVSAADLVAAEAEYDIGNGLKGLDRLMTIAYFKDILNAMLQSQQALQEIDIVQFLDWFSSLCGEPVQITQFRKQMQTVTDPKTGQLVQIPANAPMAPTPGPAAPGAPAPTATPPAGV